MGNLGGGEILVILLVALIVLGPTKLPEAARQIGRAASELRRMSGAFQRELREAINEPVNETKAIIKGSDPKPSVPPSKPASDAAQPDPAAKGPPDPEPTTGEPTEN